MRSAVTRLLIGLFATALLCLYYFGRPIDTHALLAQSGDRKGKEKENGFPSGELIVHATQSPESVAQVPTPAPRWEEATESTAPPLPMMTTTTTSLVRVDQTCPSTKLDRSRGDPMLGKGKSSGRPTIWCWMLIKPDVQELSLLRLHLCLNTSLFRCDEHTLFSNVSVRSLMGALPGASLMQEVVLQQSLETVYGGPWKTSLNTDLFIAIWRDIFRRRLHLRQEWSVKLDADTVFIPDRLTPILSHIGPPAKRNAELYMNSCSWCVVKLIGPIEIFSRAALKQLDESMNRCEKEVDYHDVSEDVFLERCFALLKIPPVNADKQDKLLLPTWRVRNHEVKHCSKGWAAIHPFKDPKLLLRCFELSFGVPS